MPPTAAAEPQQSSEVPQWLKSLPTAPEYRPSLPEFEDPIAYILKIEKEASRYGICKIIPPVPPQPKKTAIANLNRSLSSRNPSPNPNPSPTFTTRHQQIGFCPRKPRPRPVQRPVWQSGETYTLPEFESKAKQFEKAQLRKVGKRGGLSSLSSLEVEALFWKANVDKPFTVEYANDMPGSAFAAVSERRTRREEAGAGATNVGETAWNMRGVSRAKGSLLRFMREEIPGVTSPMVYIAMLFSWFAWHVEDHDLHSLNYMHMGAGKTWYGVPRDAAVAFEEVIRVHGYGGEVNPLGRRENGKAFSLARRALLNQIIVIWHDLVPFLAVTFATLGEKTTVMSPEVLISAGIPCCRLVQNVGEFVVTFPGAYHSGFSHGFNCGEASNIATPEWLRFAKEAAIRRASVNYPPMTYRIKVYEKWVTVDHVSVAIKDQFNILAPTSRAPTTIGSGPRSSRLKDKRKGEGENMVKEFFVQNMLQNNSLLSTLLEHGSSCAILPENSSEISICSNLLVGSKRKVKPRLSLGLGSEEEALGDNTLGKNIPLRHLNGFCSVNEEYLSTVGGSRPSSSHTYNHYENDALRISSSVIRDNDNEMRNTFKVPGLFSCVTCGILSYACAAIIQPRQGVSQYLMSSDSCFFNDMNVESGGHSDRRAVANAKEKNTELDGNSGLENHGQDGLYDVPVKAGIFHVKTAEQKLNVASDRGAQKGVSALDLLASAYGDSSDSDEEHVEPAVGDNVASKNKYVKDDPQYCSYDQKYREGASACPHSSSPDYELKHSLSSLNEVDIATSHASNCFERFSSESNGGLILPGKLLTGSSEHQSQVKMEKLEGGLGDYSWSSHTLSNPSQVDRLSEINKSTTIDMSIQNCNVPFMQRSDEDSTKKHMFCLEHAVEVEKQLRPSGGAHILLVCHPEYPKVEEEAKSLAEELGIDSQWEEIMFREATGEDVEIIRSALDTEEAIPGNLDWTVKLGINLYFSANLSRSPLYTTQMPYNSIIYKVFGCNSSSDSPSEPKVTTRGTSKQKKVVVAGKWCGKVWMSNQVHPYLVHREIEEESAVCSSARATKANIKLERDAENSQLSEQPMSPKETSSHTAVSRSKTLAEMRSKTFSRRKTKRRKCNELHSKIEPAEDSPEHDSPQPCGESRGRSVRIKQENPTVGRNCLKNSRESFSNPQDEPEGGPSSRLRRRPPKPVAEVLKGKSSVEKQSTSSKVKKAAAVRVKASKDEEFDYHCNMDNCSMGFSTKQELLLHKRNICSVKGCGKKFFSHKYLVQHRRVHLDDRPLKCPWKGCRMTFKWAWARTEHIRVHTGARPYVCREPGCGQTFRFVSDFSRHKRRTGHAVKGKE
ncbi:hypothetical protein Sjap_016358 [Stephania japonica]|uniref:Lysine-specific demethylase REF6 n=1 Tax=Stephania japonica TaxID=461633 RepID=A0AAP0IKW1_9MAGN